jgi:hypothetical protein
LDFDILKDFVYLVFMHMETKNGLKTLGKEIAQTSIKLELIEVMEETII